MLLASCMLLFLWEHVRQLFMGTAGKIKCWFFITMYHPKKQISCIRKKKNCPIEWFNFFFFSGCAHWEKQYSSQKQKKLDLLLLSKMMFWKQKRNQIPISGLTLRYKLSHGLIFRDSKFWLMAVSSYWEIVLFYSWANTVVSNRNHGLAE